MMNSRAEQMIVECDAFKRNAEGSWTVIRETTFSSGLGPKAAAIRLSVGTQVDLNGYIMNGVSLASLLEQRCRPRAESNRHA